MREILRLTLVSTLAGVLTSGSLLTEPPRGGEHGGEFHGPVPARGEPHPGPQDYERVTGPHGWNVRPANFDCGTYQHNLQAARSFHIGPYRRTPGWAPLIADYGL